MQGDADAVTESDKRLADFFDQIYNNILEHGWRQDDSLDDSEYLQNTIKNGKYTVGSLNMDGYYYQTRYNNAGHMQEVEDSDAIARAEAEFQAVKADLTYKEDRIDMKQKQVDAELSALSTEIDSVKNLISGGIQKAFQMFSN